MTNDKFYDNMLKMTENKDKQLNAEGTDDETAPEEKTLAETQERTEALQTEAEELVAGTPQAETVTEGNPEETPQPDAAQGMSTVDMKKRKRKNLWGFIFTIVIFAFVVYALLQLSNTLQQGNTASFTEVFSNMNGWYLVAAIAITLVLWASDTLKYTLLNRSFGCSLGIVKETKLALTGKYYECITPTGTGGQPMQIYYMYKNGVSVGKSTSVAMVKYTVQMFAAILVGAIVMGVWGSTLFNVISDGTTVHGVFISGWVGFSINACAPIFMVFVIFCPKFLKWIINLGLTILHKMHIIKKLDERRAKIFKGIDEFSVCSKFIFKHPGKFFALLGLCLVDPICGCVLPYFVLKALASSQVAGVDNLFFTVAALSNFSIYASSFIPTPGTSGAAESVFMLAFSGLVGAPIFWVTFVNRFFTYYSYILVGIGMNIYELSVKLNSMRKERKQRKALQGGTAAPPPEDLQAEDRQDE